MRTAGKQGGDPLYGLSVDDRRIRDTPQGDAAAFGKAARVPVVGKPARYEKMVPPTYRDISLTDIPVVADKATVRILSGCYQGIRGALNGSHARVTYLDITLPAGILWSYEEAHNNETLFIYLLEARLSPIRNNGRSRIRGAPYYIPFPLLEKGHMSRGCEGRSGRRTFLLLAASPLREPVAWGGPIVMNTHEELRESFEELRNGTFIK